MNGLTRKIRADEKGVSPVIGVILMVAITVILAAVIASFVFSYSGKLTEAPPQFQARLDKADDSEEAIYITHVGGDVVDLKDIKIIVKHNKKQDVYDPAAQVGGHDAFGLTDQMVIDLDNNKIKVNGKDCKAEIVTDDLDDLVSGKIVEVIFIHKPTGQIILDLTGAVT